MQIDQYAAEMEGKISLLDNRKFLYAIGFIGAYYVAFLGFLTHVIMQSGGFR